ncbi:SMR family transporter [Solirhodobacter olei]|jgi:small multidrug resistance pump|uniref:SMR family transporter n=1 Tax=Solirhodobacter olei TaxID=2493082 RepID=UPI000FDB993C|nr:SMR family transporter [Solirhodobacter olei]
MRIHLILTAAIIAEVIATTALARSAALTRLAPSLLAGVGYIIAFWLLSIALKAIPTGIVYAVWSGLGIVFITAVAWIFYRQRLDAPALIGLGLIVAGVLVINLFSGTVSH